MKRYIYFLLLILVSIVLSCSRQGNDKQPLDVRNSQKQEPEEIRYEVLDPYIYMLMHYTIGGNYSDQLVSRYGYKQVHSTSEFGTIQELFVKKCSYDHGSFAEWSDKSCAIGYKEDESTLSFFMYAGNRDEINAKLSKYGFDCENYENENFYVDNDIVGIESYRSDGGVWKYTLCLDKSEDYPFYPSLSFDDVERLLNNELKIEDDYRSKRLRMRGTIYEIEERGLIFKQVVYRFKKDDGLFPTVIRYYVSKDESSYNLELPANIIISGFVTDVEGNGIYLKSVRLFDLNKKHYVGPNYPKYNLYPQNELQTSDPESGEDFLLKGYLSDGNKEYGIEMFLMIDDNEVDGYYRYLSKPENALISLKGSVELEPTGGTGVYSHSKHVTLISEDNKERFTFEMHPAYQEVEGKWSLYNTPSDAESGVASKVLDVHLIWE